MEANTVSKIGRTVLIAAAFISLAITFFVAYGYGNFVIRHIVGLFWTINSRLGSSPSHPFEEWLVIAVATTIPLNIIFYATNFLAVMFSFINADKKNVGFLAILLAFVFFLILPIPVGVVWPYFLMSSYLSSPYAIEPLKNAAMVMIILFVLYDAFMIGFGKIVPGHLPKEMEREGWLTFWRVDLPIIVAYSTLLLFSDYSIDKAHILQLYSTWPGHNELPRVELDNHAMLTISSFVAGAAAFKLVISNLLFLILMIELHREEQTTVVPSTPVAAVAQQPTSAGAVENADQDQKKGDKSQDQSSAAKVAAPNIAPLSGRRTKKQVPQGQAPAVGLATPNDAAPPEQKTDPTSQSQNSVAAPEAPPPGKKA
jgi:hypothetical protein